MRNLWLFQTWIHERCWTESCGAQVFYHVIFYLEDDYGCPFNWPHSSFCILKSLKAVNDHFFWKKSMYHWRISHFCSFCVNSTDLTTSGIHCGTYCVLFLIGGFIQSSSGMMWRLINIERTILAIVSRLLLEDGRRVFSYTFPFLF